jgi:hypothetical protein
VENSSPKTWVSSANFQKKYPKVNNGPMDENSAHLVTLAGNLEPVFIKKIRSTPIFDAAIERWNLTNCAKMIIICCFFSDRAGVVGLGLFSRATRYALVKLSPKMWPSQFFIKIDTNINCGLEKVVPKCGLFLYFKKLCSQIGENSPNLLFNSILFIKLPTW